MNRYFNCVLSLAGAATLAHAHFVFVVPDADGAKAKVIMSETLKPDPQVGIAIISGTKLASRTAGVDSPLPLVKADQSLEVALAGKGLRVIHGVTDLGITQRGGKPHILIYYPKTILGDPFDQKSVLGKEVPAEIVPTGRAGKLSLTLLSRGKPQSDAEITVILPDGSEKKLKTDASGQTETLPQTGRFGAWARFWEATPGERDGKKYEEVRHYATLVFDVPVASASFATLPQATSSFGAVESDGWLYVYGGHIAPTHRYWKEAVSGRFYRLNLAGPNKWEELPVGPPLQGMNLTAHAGKIYRAGGMAPRNSKGEPTDNRSLAECARFEPGSGKWDALPPLPQPRSSHDVVAVNGRLIVVGGWNLQGGTEEWVDTIAIMDLSSKKPGWRSVRQPFRRRALIAVTHQSKMYVIGGFSEQGQIVRKVSIFEPETEQWSEGPDLPAGVGLAFAPAAAVHQGRLYASVSDGSLLRLDESGAKWEAVSKTTPRVAHRMVSHGAGVLVIGGAAKGDNLHLVEAVPVEGRNSR